MSISEQLSRSSSNDQLVWSSEMLESKIQEYKDNKLQAYKIPFMVFDYVYPNEWSSIQEIAGLYPYTQFRVDTPPNPQILIFIAKSFGKAATKEQVIAELKKSFPDEFGGDSSDEKMTEAIRKMREVALWAMQTRLHELKQMPTYIEEYNKHVPKTFEKSVFSFTRIRLTDEGKKRVEKIRQLPNYIRTDPFFAPQAAALPHIMHVFDSLQSGTELGAYIDTFSLTADPIHARQGLRTIIDGTDERILYIGVLGEELAIQSFCANQIWNTTETPSTLSPKERLTHAINVIATQNINAEEKKEALGEYRWEASRLIIDDYNLFMKISYILSLRDTNPQELENWDKITSDISQMNWPDTIKQYQNKYPDAMFDTVTHLLSLDTEQIITSLNAFGQTHDSFPWKEDYTAYSRMASELKRFTLNLQLYCHTPQNITLATLAGTPMDDTDYFLKALRLHFRDEEQESGWMTLEEIQDFIWRFGKGFPPASLEMAVLKNTIILAAQEIESEGTIASHHVHETIRYTPAVIQKILLAHQPQEIIADVNSYQQLVDERDILKQELQALQIQHNRLQTMYEQATEQMQMVTQYSELIDSCHKKDEKRAQTKIASLEEANLALKTEIERLRQNVLEQQIPIEEIERLQQLETEYRNYQEQIELEKERITQELQTVKAELAKQIDILEEEQRQKSLVLEQLNNLIKEKRQLSTDLQQARQQLKQYTQSIEEQNRITEQVSQLQARVDTLLQSKIIDDKEILRLTNELKEAQERITELEEMAEDDDAPKAKEYSQSDLQLGFLRVYYIRNCVLEGKIIKDKNFPTAGQTRLPFRQWQIAQALLSGQPILDIMRRFEVTDTQLAEAINAAYPFMETMIIEES